MAASEESCDGNPDFAVICSFILKFGDDCGVNVTIPCLQQMLEDTKNVHEDLAELHIHLLRRGRKRVTKERWEKCLIKFCHEYSSVDAWELERFGYKKAKLSVKLELLKRLLELQFDANVKFKTEVNKNDAHSLRIAPIGRDINGQMYWYQLDKDYNMRLYRQGVGDENMWQLVCSNTDHLKNLLTSLEKNITDTTGLISEDTPKVEDIDTAVPKKEKSGEDLTSCMSETKPCTIIIKTEKRENNLSGKVTSAVKTPIKDEVLTKDSDISVIEKDSETAAENTVAAESKEKVSASPDNPLKPCGIVIKKEMCFDLAESNSKIQDDTTPMEVDDAKKEKDKDSDLTEVASNNNDVEMISVESAPVVDKRPSSPVAQDASKDVANVTTPLDTTKSLPADDVPETKFKGSKIKLYEKWSNEKKHVTAPEPVEEVKLSPATTENKLSPAATDPKPSPAATDLKQSPAAANLKEPINTKETLPEDLTVSHKASSESALNKSKSLNVTPSKLSLHADSARGEEVPMDLSVSCRSSSDANKSSASDLSASLNKKRPLSDLDTSNLSYNGGNVRSSFPANDSAKTIDMKYPNSSEAPRPLKKKHLSIAKEEPLNVKESIDHSRKSVIFEVKNSKLLNQYQENKPGSDPLSGRTSNSGFSHLQALQNMCNENPMTCFQGNVIHSSSHDKRSSFEGSLMKYGLGPVEKSSYNEATCDTLSKKYSFSNTQLSGDLKHVSERTDPPPLLKSNVHAGPEVSFKEHFHAKPDAPRETHGQKLAAKIDQLVQQNKDFSSDKGKCAKSVNQNLLPTIEKDIGEVKDLHLNEKMKKELREKSCSQTESVSLSEADLSSSSRKSEKPFSESKVKHTISSMLNTDKASSKSDDPTSFSSSFISKPSDVPAIVTSNHAENILPKHVPDSDREVLSSLIEKNSNIIKSSKIELKKDSVASFQDNVSEQCIKPEITQPLSLKNTVHVSTDPEKLSLSKDSCSTLPESKNFHAKSLSNLVSKPSEVPSSDTLKSVNWSEIIEQKTISTNFQLEKDSKTSKKMSTVKLKEETSNSTLDEKSSPPLSQNTDRTVVGKSSIHVSEEDNSVSKVESTDLEQEKLKGIKSKNSDLLMTSDNLQKPAELNKDLKSLKDECLIESSQVVTPKKETSKTVETASLKTMSCKSEVLPSPVEKCDKEKSMDNSRLEKSPKETIKLNTNSNFEKVSLEASALDSESLNETAVNIKQDQSSNDNKTLKENVPVPSESSPLNSNKLQSDKTDIKSPIDKSVSQSSLAETGSITEPHQTKLKNESSALDNKSENGISEKPEVLVESVNSSENHITMKSKKVDAGSERKQIGGDQIIEKPQTAIELSKHAVVDQSNKKDVKPELLPAETEKSDQKEIIIAKNSETNLSLEKEPSVKSETDESEKQIMQTNKLPAETESSDQKEIIVSKNSKTNLSSEKESTVKSETDDVGKQNTQTNCDLSDSSNKKESFTSAKPLVASEEKVSQKSETNTESSDKILESKVNEQSIENANVSPQKALPVQPEKEIAKTTDKESSHPSKTKTDVGFETEVKSTEEKLVDPLVETKIKETCKIENVSLSSDDSSQMKSSTTESEKKKPEKLSIDSTDCAKESEDMKSSVVSDSSSVSVSVVSTETENKETSQVDSTKMKLQSSQLEESAVVSKTHTASLDLKTSGNKVTEKLETGADLVETKSINSEHSENKTPGVEKNSMQKASANELEDKIDSKSSISMNCPRETLMGAKSEKICSQTKKDASPKLKSEEAVDEDISTKQSTQVTAPKIKPDEVSSVTEATSSLTKDKTDDKSKNEVSKNEINSKSISKKTSKTGVTDIKQKVSTSRLSKDKTEDKSKNEINSESLGKETAKAEVTDIQQKVSTPRLSKDKTDDKSKNEINSESLGKETAKAEVTDIQQKVSTSRLSKDKNDDKSKNEINSESLGKETAKAEVTDIQQKVSTPCLSKDKTDDKSKNEINSESLGKETAKAEVTDIQQKVSTSRLSKDKTDDKSKNEINSESLGKETAKAEATDIQQKDLVCSSVSSTKLNEDASSQQKDIPAKDSTKSPSCSTGSNDIKSISKAKETPKSECSEKIADSNARKEDTNKEDTTASSVAPKKNQRTSGRASRSSRKKSHSSQSVSKEEIKEADGLSAKSEPTTEILVKDESTARETKKKLEQRKINENDKHIHSDDEKMDCDATLVTGKEKNLKGIKKESLDVSEKTISSGKAAKCDISVCKLDIQNPLNLYLVMNCRCLETKGRHPQCGKLSEKPLTSPSKPKLITTFSLDTVDDVQIIKMVESPTVGRKKRGRLRQSSSISKSPAPPPHKPKPEPAPVKSSPRAPRGRPGRNSKKPAATSGKDDFTIPEGFLEILSNSQSDIAKSEPRRKYRGPKAKISTPSAQSSESESAPIKRSRRIQEQHQKKMSELAVEMEREQRILEQLAKKSKKPVTPKSPAKSPGPKTPRATKAKFEPPTPEDTCLESKRTTRKMNSRSRNMTKMTLMYEDESKDSEFSTSRETEKSKKRRRGKGAKKGYKPWDLSSESSSSVEEITEEEEEEEPDEPLIFEVNEDEFACEEVDENAEVVVVRRARTAKKAPEDTATEGTVVTDDKPCSKCGKYDKPEWILLCDKCDNGYHTTCLIPPLVIIPEGDWYCQPCEHTFLCETLQKELHNLEIILKQREREELRKQRLAYVGISLDNVLKPEKKEKSDESSKEEEEEEEEEEANEAERKRRRHKESSDDERHKKLYGQRSVRARRTVNYQFKEYDALIASAIQEEMLDKLTEDEEDIKEKEKSEESDKSFTAKIPKRGKRKRVKRLNDLDFSDEDEDSGDEYKGSSSDSEQTAPPSRSGSDAGSAASGEWRIVKSKTRAARKPRRKRNDSSDEDWDDNESETYRPATRRAAQKAVVSYKEISSDDEWDPKPKSASKKRKKATSSEDSEASFKKKKPKRKSRVRKWASSSSEEESEQSMSFSGSSQGSENEWKVKKSSEGNNIKININKKVLSSDENDDSRESAPAPKKKERSNKVVSDPESEEEDEEGEEEEEEESSEEEDEEEDDDEDEEEDDDDEEEEEEKDVKDQKPKDVPSSKPKDIPSKPKELPSKPKELPSKPKEVPSKPNDAPTKPNDVPSKPKDVPLKINVIPPKPKDISSKPVVEPIVKDVPPKAEIKSVCPVKEPVKVDTPKVVERIDVMVKKESALPVVEPVKEKVVVMTVKDKPPQRTVKKDATKMVPCVIPYDKSPKSGHGATADEEGDKEISRSKKDSVSTAKHLSFPKMVSTSNVIRAPNPTSKPFTSTIIQPFSNIDDENESDDEVPLERIPTTASTSIPTKSLSFTRDSEYTPAKELSGFSYTTPEEKCFPPTYSSLTPFQDYSSRPSPLKPSLVETYSNNSSPSKLTPLDSYSNTNSPKGFISLDSYSDSRKKKQHFYGTPEPEAVPRPVPSEGYQGEIRFPPSPSTYAPRSPSHVARDAGTPPRFHSQYPDTYAPPRSPEYYPNQPYYQGEERIPRSTYQPNYVPPEPVPPFVPNPYVATPVMQPNGGFMIDTLLRARNPENEEDELTGVTDIVSYITQE